MAENQDRSHKNDIGKATWLKIFTAFKLAIDVKKLLLAAMGILVTYFGWWVLSQAFYKTRSIPQAGTTGFAAITEKGAKDDYLDYCVRFSLIHELAGTTSKETADALGEWEKELAKADVDDASKLKIKQLVDSLKREEPGRLRGCPWDEYRGPNQFLYASQLIQQGATGSSHPENEKAVKSYLLYMVEPLCKFLIPVTYFFDTRAGGFFSWNRLYLLLILFWTVATWGYFGGAISRMATVQLARNEKVGLRESLQFVSARWQGYVFAPVLPIVALLFMGFGLWFMGLFVGWTFALGDIVAGLLWPLVIILGLVMAGVFVGLIGWPLMNATISTEGSDSFDALSRSYSYVFQVPWYYLGYAVAALLYGAVLVFFVGFMSTLLVYFGRWGIKEAPVLRDRDPAYLFQYAPGSFGWREVLLKDSPFVEKSLDGHYSLKEDNRSWWEHSSIGTYLVTLWLGLFFLLVLGFGYSYFWTAATIIYLLLRQRVDDTDFDEVYLEEDMDQPFVPEAAAPTPPPPTGGASSAPPGVTFTMVEAPALHPPSGNDTGGSDAPKPAPFGNSPPPS